MNREIKYKDPSITQVLHTKDRRLKARVVATTKQYRKTYKIIPGIWLNANTSRQAITSTGIPSMDNVINKLFRSFLRNENRESRGWLWEVLMPVVIEVMKKPMAMMWFKNRGF